MEARGTSPERRENPRALVGFRGRVAWRHGSAELYDVSRTGIGLAEMVTERPVAVGERISITITAEFLRFGPFEADLCWASGQRAGLRIATPHAPQMHAMRDLLASQATLPECDAPVAEGAHILVLDPDEEHAFVIGVSLESAGYEPHWAYTLEGAREIATKHALDLILADVTAASSAEELRADLGDSQRGTAITAPVLWMTSSNPARYEGSRSEVLQKPLDPATLLQLVGQIL